MRKNTAESTEPQQTAAVASPSPKTKIADRNWMPLAIMGAIMFLAAFVRVAFSFGLSAGSDFALSGGTEASNNLRFVESIVADGKIRFTDNWLNYPNGTLVVVPILFDLVMALFGMIFNVFLHDATTASSLALALSGPVFAVAACIPMYFVGKEMFSSKLAGYLSALFLALCPVFVEESVFSNGSGMSFALFFFLFGIYFLIRAIKNLNEAVSAYKTAIIAGVFVMLAMLSWTDVRNVAIPFVIVMVFQVIVDRFKGKDPRPAATVYTMVAAIGFIIPLVAYIVAGYWDAIASGPMIFIVLAIGFTTAYAWTSSKPWIITLPVISVVCLAILAVLAVAAPGLFDCVVSGNLYYDSAYWSSLGRQYLTLSKLTLYYGVVTYWFVFLLCLYMLYRYLRNASSALYTFTMVWLFTMTLTLGHNSLEAAFAAPVFALGFAAVCKAVLAHVDFKAYFSGIKTGAGKVRFKRIVSPIPFISILVAVLLIAAPNMMQVVDAGISSNDVDDYNEKASKITGSDQFGSLGYYIKTDDSWSVRDALKNVHADGGAFVTWMSYSDDVKIYANAKCFTDMYGNGTDVASNILLSNAVNGSSAAALLITSIMKKGMTDDTKTKLTASGFTAADIELIGNVLDDAGYKVGGKSVCSIVTEDYGKYGAVDSGISDLNVKYLFLTNYIAENYHSYDITKAYDALGLRSPYIMVTGDMMPLFVGYSNVFDEMALLNGYNVDGSYGTVSKFTTFGYYAYYYGVYNFTDAMYDTMLYRTYIGMTPAQAGYASLYEYILALSNADASVKMYPGYGLSNYEIAYWTVMYNPSNNATADSSGWVSMDALEAIALQKVSGGRINYLSGSPVILRYVPNTSGNIVTGVVDDGTAGIADIRVVAVDSQGIEHATTHTSADGSFKLFVSDTANTTLVYYAGAGIASSGGVIVGTTPAAAPGLHSVDTTADITLQMRDGTSTPIDVAGYDVTLTNTATDEKYTNTFTDIGYGVYSVVIKKNDTEVANTTLTINGDGVYTVALDVYTYKITVQNMYRQPLAGKTVTLDGDFTRNAVTDAEGTATFVNIPKGSYEAAVDGYYVDKIDVSISSNASKTITAYSGTSCTITAPAAGAVVSIVGDAYSYSYVSEIATETKVLPVSGISSTVYTVYSIYNGMFYSATTSTPTVSLTSHPLVTVTGTLKDSDGAGVPGTVTFVNGDEKYVYSAAADGTYRAYLPAVAFGTVYATNSSDAYFGTLDLTTAGAAATFDIEMLDADKVSSTTVYWSSTYYSYVMMSAKVNSAAYTLPIMTKDGGFSFYLPRGMDASVSIGLVGSGFNAVTDKTVAADHTADNALSFSLTSASTAVKVNNDIGVVGSTNLSIGGVTHTVDEWGSTESFSLTSYSRSVVLGSSNDAVYYSGTHYFSPETAITSVNLSELLNGKTLAEITYNTVTVDDNTSDYDIRVYYGDDSYTTVTGTGAVRIAETASEYSIFINKLDDTYVFYDKFTGNGVFHVSQCVPAVRITGNVGANIGGTIVFSETAALNVPAKLTDGSYSALLKKDVAYTADLDETTGGIEYIIEGAALPAQSASTTYNLMATQATTMVHVTPAVTLDGAVAKVQFTIPAGTIANTTKNIESFDFSVGSGWQSYEFTISGNVVDGLSIAAESSLSSPIQFTGYYNLNMNRLGTSALAVSVNGSEDKYPVFFDTVTGTDGIIYVNKDSDVVGDNTYEYVYKFVNIGSSKQDVTYDFTGTSDTTGWYMCLKAVDDCGCTGLIPTPMTGTIGIMPGTTTISVVFMKVSTTDSAIPSLKVDFANANLATATADEITVTAGHAVSETSSEDAVVSATSMAASGRGVINDQGKMPVIVWVMLALIVLLIVLLFWMASKRGVFARKK